MKSLLITFLLTLGLTSNIYAADSTWLLCNDDKLVINLHEHRLSVDSRETTVYLIHGVHVLSGNFKDEGYKVSLRGGKNTFKGLMKIDFTKNSVSLAGNLNLYGSEYKIQTDFDCQEMTGKL